jgi:dipeptidyl aminopeptidase/acylaminoacyl peptidase
VEGSTKSGSMTRFLRLAVFSLVLVLVLMLVGLPMGLSYLYIDTLVDHPCADHPELLPERFPDIPMEAVQFTPEADVTLDGWYASGSNGAGIIVLPGAWGGANTMYSEFEMLHEAGYSVLTYDTRSCANPPVATSLGYTEIIDLKAAIDLMLTYPEVTQVAVFGHSMGGATAIMSAAQDDRIRAVVATGNYADLSDDIRRDTPNQGLLERFIRFWVEQFYEWRTGVDVEHVSPLDAIGEIAPRPVYLIHGTEELPGGQEQYDAAGEPKQLWIVEGAGHGDYPEVDFERYRDSTITFYNQALLE